MYYLKFFISSILTINAFSVFAQQSLYTKRNGKILDTIRAVPAIQANQVFNYSTYDATTYYPKSGAPITIFQSDGVNMFFCDSSGLTIGTSDIYASMVWKSPYGSRFSSSQIAQAFLSVYCQVLMENMYSTWRTQTLASITGATTSLTCTSSGICVSIKCASSSASALFTALGSFITSAKALTPTDAQINTALTNMITELTTFTGGTYTNNQTVHYEIMCKPKLDCAMTQAQNIAVNNSVMLGADAATCYNLLKAIENTTDLLTHTRAVKTYIDANTCLEVFLASGASGIKASLTSYAQTLFTTGSTNYIDSITIPAYGTVMAPGNGYTIYRDGATNIITSGGIVYLGPVTATNLLAGSMFAKIAKDRMITNQKYDRAFYIAVVPFAGNVTVRFMSNQFQGSPRDAFDDLINGVKSRYDAGANTADFSAAAFLTLFNETVAVATATTSLTELTSSEAIHQPLIANSLEALVHWMQIYFGAFGITSEYAAATTNAQKTAMLTNAAAVLVNKSTSANSVFLTYQPS